MNPVKTFLIAFTALSFASGFSYDLYAQETQPSPVQILPNGDVLMKREQAEYLARRLEEMAMLANEYLAQRDQAIEILKRERDAEEKRHAMCL